MPPSLQIPYRTTCSLIGFGCLLGFVLVVGEAREIVFPEYMLSERAGWFWKACFLRGRGGFGIRVFCNGRFGLESVLSDMADLGWRAYFLSSASVLSVMRF